MIVLRKADGMVLTQEEMRLAEHLAIKKFYRVCSEDGKGDMRNRAFTSHKEAVRYFKTITADYCVKDNTLEETTKIDMLVIRKR